MSETIGERLKQARQARHLMIAQVAQATRIRAHYLEALEADDFSVMPSAAQGRGFLRLYAQFLSLDVDQLLADLRRAEVGAESAEPPSTPEEPPLVEEQVEVQEEGPSAEEEALEQPKRRLFWQSWLSRLRRPADETPAEPSTGETERMEPTEPAVAEIEPIEVEEVAPVEETRPPLSRAIFAEIGAGLRQRREMLSLTLDEIEQHTRVRKHYLQALETGDFGQLPSPVQTRGMLNNYASFLDLDAEALLLRFAEGLQAQWLERHPAQTGKVEDGLPRPRGRLPLRSFVAADLLFGIGMVVLLVGFAIWGASRILAARSKSVEEPTAPSISDILLASPVATFMRIEATLTFVPGTLIPGGETPTIAVPTGASQARVQVTVVVVGRTWMRVTVDGRVKFEGRVLPGSAYSFEGENQIEVLTGNAAALQILYNRNDMGLMGTFGEVVNRIYSPTGILTPTATATPTNTATPRLSPTPTLTPTPIYTPTATPQE